MAACSICPLLTQCEAELQSRLAAGAKICEQIMAGRLFTVNGVEVAPQKIDEYADQRGRPKKKRPQSIRPTQTTEGPVVGCQLPLFEGAAS